MKLIDRYLVVDLWKRLLVALSVVLTALLIERIIRLLDAVNLKGGPIIMVWEMALMLVPHYLGLALPAAFFFSIYLTVSSCHQNNEFDVLLGAGMSPLRFAISFAVTAVLLVGLSVMLLGYLQPYSRYDYRAIDYLVDSAPWGARIPERIFANADRSATVSADHVAPDGRSLSGVFVHFTDSQTETAVTARKGWLAMDGKSATYRLILWDGVLMITRPDGAVHASAFKRLTIARDLKRDIAPFRQRGSDVRELTLSELVLHRKEGIQVEAGAELQARLARSVSLAFLPFLAIPLAITSRRKPRSTGIVLGALVLVIFHYILQTLQGLAANGRVSSGSLWIATAAFAVLSFSLFWQTQQRPGQSVLDPVMSAAALGIAAVAAHARRLGFGRMP